MSEVSFAEAPGVIGTNGETITLESLPDTNTTRWVTSRKAQVVAAIRGGLLTLEEASLRYRLTLDELAEWQASLERHGARGLRATFVQQYRHVRGS
jgi:hypothetical protein